MKKLVFVILLFTVLSGLWSAPKSELLENWNRSNIDNNKVVDHKLWNDFLKQYVLAKNGMNLVDYSNVDKEGINNLDKYLDYLSSLTITNFNKDEQKSFWINIYNALTVKIVLDYYPIKSIKDLNISGFLKFGPWDKKIVTIESSGLSLNDIEHRILRPIWNDKRVHYALNCASMGCPEIQNVSFTPDNINFLLNSSEKKYLESSHGVKIIKNTLILSSIFDWYSVDFGKTEDEVLTYIKRFIDLGDFKKIKYDYNWSLNDYNK